MVSFRNARNLFHEAVWQWSGRGIYSSHATGAQAITEGRFPWTHALFFFNLEPAMVVRPGLGEEVTGCCGVRRKPSVQYDKQRHVKNIKVFASSMETIFTIMYQNDQ